MAALCEAGHNPICGGEAVAVMAGFEWLHQDYIGVHMIGEHDEVVATSGANQAYARSNSNAILIVPMGCPVIIHNKPSTRRSWDFCGRKSLNIGPALNRYRCFLVANDVTKSLLFSDTVEFMHN